MKGKACSHCGQLGIPFIDFRLRKDGYFQSWCRRCEADLIKRRTAEKRESDPGHCARALARVKKWASKNRERINERQRDWRARNEGSVHAHSVVALALKAGKLKKEPCVVCGTTEHLEAHHHDYTKPLDVTWFCRRHHSHVHLEFA